MGSAYQIRDQSLPHFLTFQVVGWADIFTRQVYRDIVIDSFRYCREHKGLKLFAYVIMTNHVHVIIQSDQHNLSNLIRDIKKFTSKKIFQELSANRQESRKEWLEMIFKYHAKYTKRSGAMQFWTHDNHAIELGSNELIDTRLDYIHMNPVRAGWVLNPEDYLYSSASFYAGREGLIEVDEI